MGAIIAVLFILFIWLIIYASKADAQSTQVSSTPLYRDVRQSSNRPKSIWTCSCGAKNREDLKYCPVCQKMRAEAESGPTIKCPNCGSMNNSKREKCVMCDTPLDKSAADALGKALNEANSKEEIFEVLFTHMRQKTPSEHFATGAVFDIVRQNREIFVKNARELEVIALTKLFASAYTEFCKNPQIAGLPSNMINTSNNDTDPSMWNASAYTLPNGDAVALCFMPIRHDSIEARMIGIVFSALKDNYDGYYFCMVNKDKDAVSEVKQNAAGFGIRKIGEVKGRGFDLADNFKECIYSNFCSNGEEYF